MCLTHFSCSICWAISLAILSLSFDCLSSMSLLSLSASCLSCFTRMFSSFWRISSSRWRRRRRNRESCDFADWNLWYNLGGLGVETEPELWPRSRPCWFVGFPRQRWLCGTQNPDERKGSGIITEMSCFSSLCATLIIYSLFQRSLSVDRSVWAVKKIYINVHARVGGHCEMKYWLIGW